VPVEWQIVSAWKMADSLALSRDPCEGQVDIMARHGPTKSYRNRVIRSQHGLLA
jgi:hypothetical protein